MCLGCDSRGVFFRFCQVKDEGEPVPTTHLDVFPIRYVHSGYTRMNEYEYLLLQNPDPATDFRSAA